MSKCFIVIYPTAEFKSITIVKCEEHELPAFNMASRQIFKIKNEKASKLIKLEVIEYCKRLAEHTSLEYIPPEF